VRIAIGHADRAGWVRKHTRISLVGDHPNDVAAARLNGIQAVAVCTGVCAPAELTACRPDILLSDLRSLRLDMLL
jgi:phosphoglycolate phosphatase